MRYWSGGPDRQVDIPKKGLSRVSEVRGCTFVQELHRIFRMSFFFLGLIYIVIVFLKLLSLSFLFDQFFHITSNIKSPDKKYVGVFNKSITVAASITDMQDNLHGPGPGAYVSRSNFPNEKMRRARSVPDFMSRLGSFRGEI